jgi:hypothetical protein
MAYSVRDSSKLTRQILHWLGAVGRITNGKKPPIHWIVKHVLPGGEQCQYVIDTMLYA